MALIKTKQPKHDAPDVQFEKLYRDRITGFEGVCTGICRYVSGCDQVLLQPIGLDKDGKRKESIWIDDERLIDVDAKVKVARTSRRGGPQDHEAPCR